MSLRRKVPTDFQDVKRSRGSYKGSITKTKDKLLAMESRAVEAYDIRELERLRTVAKETEDKFQVTLDEAQAFMPEGSDRTTFNNQEDELAEQFSELITEAINKATCMIQKNIIYWQLQALNKKLKAMRDLYNDRPALNQEDTAKQLIERSDQLYTDWVTEGLPRPDPLMDELEQFQERLSQLRSEMTPSREASTTPGSTRSFGMGSADHFHTGKGKLPDRALPKFTGDIMKWSTFWAGFTSAVEGRGLNPYTKLSYLRDCIKDPATQKIMATTKETEDSYQQAVDKLQQRFNRPKEVHRLLMAKIRNFTTAKYTRESLWELADDFQNIKEGLEGTNGYTADQLLSSLVYLLSPNKLQQEWEKHSIETKEVTPVDDFLTYIRAHAQTIASSSTAGTISTTQPERKTSKKAETHSFKPKNNVHVVTTKAPYRWDCKLCSEKHPLFICPKWQELSLHNKLSHVQANNLCHNCLAVGHSTTDCKNPYRCKECSAAHHTSIHQIPATPVHTYSTLPHQMPDALMMTAKVMLWGPGGQSIPGRALIDQAAGVSLISHRVAQQLNLPLTRQDMRFRGAQEADCKGSKYLTNLTVTTKQGEHRFPLKAAVVNKVTTDLPTQELLPATTIPHFQGLELADSNFNIPGGIDLILGAETSPYVMTEEPPIIGELHLPLATNTIFGWALVGPSEPLRLPSCNHTLHHLQAETTNNQLSEQMHMFWRAEEADQAVGPHTHGEQLAETLYQTTTTYSAEDNRYTVSLPWKPDTIGLGNSRAQAISRYKSNEKAITTRGIYSLFQAEVQSYIDLGHAELVPNPQLIPSQHYYLPMHCVIKNSSTTTKLRVVFDGSAATSTGISLNQALLVGPTIQPTLETTLLKFRTYPVALTADISKMYREVALEESARDFHRFVWRAAKDQVISDYRMKRVTFGISASPYLAIRTLAQVAADHAQDNPLISHHLLESFYVDDFLAGAATIEEALHLFKSIRPVLQKAGFHLRKWKTSSKAVRALIPPDLQDTLPTSQLVSSENTGGNRTLGLSWDYQPDTMGPFISQPGEYTPTKRGIVSDVSKTFDILGWIAPAVLVMKLLYQELWKAQTDWDEPVPAHIQEAHQQWREQLPLLTQKQLRRCYHRPDAIPLTMTLHGFADACKTSYGAVIYIRTTYKDHPPEMSLVRAKTRVVKLKDINSELFTIPRKELCAAELLTQLLASTQQVLNISAEDTFAWSDSTIVLAWISGIPTNYKTFVCNRLQKILKVTAAECWRYIPSADNPADCASRGLPPKELLEFDLWWSGPPWLLADPPQVPHQPPRGPRIVDEQNIISCYTTLIIPPPILESQHPSYHKLVKVTAWCLRFIQRTLHRPRVASEPLTLLLQACELTQAEVWLARRSQERTFTTERSALLSGKPCPKPSALHSLAVHLDKDRLIRVGGRLSLSYLSLSQQHPVVVSSKDILTINLFNYLHESLGHCGPTLLLTAVGWRFYVIGAKALSRKTCRSCKTCRRVEPKPVSPYMGELPQERTLVSPAFTTTGMDFAGPFLIKQGHIRRPSKLKAYVCVFICFATKAIHLEVVSDETTPAFLACLTRFISRRGCPKTLYSDNGSNFVGARNQYHKLLKTTEMDTAVHQHLLKSRITWKNIPAHSPHFGGLWEAAVRSMKKHLRRIMGQHLLTFEELTTVICQIEAFLNSRPLLPITSPGEDGVTPLTPGHFLVFRPLAAYPVDSAIAEQPKLGKRWQLCCSLAQHYWTRWSREYLHTLQRRNKWTNKTVNLLPGDIVVLKEDRTFACYWPIARILETYPGDDGHTRVALIQTATSKYKRPVTKLALLHREQQGEPDKSDDSIQPASPGSMFRPATPPRLQAEQPLPSQD